MFENYSKLIQRHPKAVIAVWIVALLVALPFAAQVGDALNYDMTSMGGFDSESSEGQAIVEEHFGGSLTTDTVLAIPYEDDGELSRIDSGLIDSGVLSDAVGERYGDSVGLTVLGSYGNGDSGVFLVSFSVGGGLSSMDEVGNLRSVVASAMDDAGLSDMRTYVTGSVPIAYDTLQGANADMSVIDPISIVLIFVLLGLFFCSLVTAAVPPLVVGTAYGIVLSLIFALGGVMDIFYITRVIVLVSMLGAGCDYSVFIISRYREERRSGKSKEDALSEAVVWAGESVLTSGLAVIIGFAVMALCSYSLVSSMAIVLAIGIVLAMLAALTLIPAVISIVGDRVFWPRDMEFYRRMEASGSGLYGRLTEAGRRYFTWAGKFSVNHAKAIVAVAILITVPLGYTAVTSDDSFDMISVMPDSEAKNGVDAITESTDGGLLMPTYALVQLDSPIAEMTDLGGGMGVLRWTSEGQTYLAGLSELQGRFTEADSNVSYVMGPVSWSALYSMAHDALVQAGYPEGMVTPEMVNRAVLSQIPDVVSDRLEAFFGSYGWNLTPDTALPLSPEMQATVSSLLDYAVNTGAGLVSSDGMYVQMMIVVSDEPMSQESMASVGTARDVLEVYASENPWAVDAWVLGTPAVLYDISGVVNTEFHWIEVGVILLIYVLLMLVLGSYFTPIRSLATIMMGVVWTLGVLQLVFVHALGAEVVWIVPIVLFVICLGLGMDYDILLTTRIREGKVRGMSNDIAIRDSLMRSGGIITLCGLIMGGTFLTLLLSGSVMLKEIGFALGFAILLDSLVVVPYVVPALMHLMGDWSWKGPKFLQRRSEGQS
ncbi:MAG: hypothetical protein A3205_00030 [Methanomassiliicoccales archaeon Mx-03]|nr:MAG: hypothetical protein A3205_00030 [Methanomassiliicoccales archaeon Mx-03]